MPDFDLNAAEGGGRGVGNRDRLNADFDKSLIQCDQTGSNIGGDHDETNCNDSWLWDGRLVLGKL